MRFIHTLGKANQATLRKEFGFKTINEAIEFYGEDKIKKKKKYSEKTKNIAYEIMRKEYNKIVEELKEQNKTQQKIKRNAQAKAKRDMKKQQIKSKIFKLPENNLSNLRDALKKYVGKNVMVDYVVGKNIIRSKEYNIPSNFSSWWKKTSLNDWMYDSEEALMQYHKNQGQTFIYEPAQDLNTNRVVQAFRDGVNHCVFTPIRNWAIAKEEEAKTEKTKYRYSGMIKKINALEEKYINGVPENAISEICNTLQIDISIELPFCENKFIESQSIKKRLKFFKFMNTRLNHIDLNEVVNNDEYIEVTRKELFEIKKQLDEANEFYTYKKDMNSINCISTLTKQYKLKNNMTEVIADFELETGLKFCQIDDVDDYELSQFIREGTNYNATVDFRKDIYDIDISSIKHIDMKNAYTKFQSCLFYEGFLGKISDFRKCNKIMGVGMYKITNLVFPIKKYSYQNKFSKYNDIMKIYISNNVYTSPELKMLSYLGATYDIVCGCWGVKPIKFEFNDDMLNNKDDEGVWYYAKWAGMCDMHHMEKKFWINGDMHYFNAIRDYCGEGVVRWYENNSGCIAFKKKHNYHLGHITAFILAYQRISVIEQLMEIDYDNVVRVCVDGIYHLQEMVELKNAFRSKPDINFNNLAGDSYVSSAIEKDLVICGASEREHFEKELHLGEGGCGKTHFNCNDKGLVKVLFLAPSWKLARCKKNETGINSSVWARALTEDPERITAIRDRANVLIIDEVSMLSEGQKQQFFELYSDMKIIMCGDLGYQLPCIVGEEMTTKGFDNIVKHKTDYRCKDADLKKIKDDLRLMISYGRSKNEINKWVVDEFKRLGRTISLDDLKASYKVEDMILCGTNELKDYYTNIFAGKFPVEKYYVMENNRLHSNGDIVIGNKPEQTKCEVRHSFTTHSIQGETANHNLFIDSVKMFDSRMFYTAISRARYLNQIFIINENQAPSFKYNGTIYKITCNKKVYIGSTIQSIEQRFKEHENGWKNYKKGKGSYITSYELFDLGSPKISKIENFRCNEIKQLQEREAEIISQTKCVNKTFNEEK